MRGESSDELDDVGARHVAVGIGAVVANAREPALPVGSQQPQGVPALAPPRVRQLAALEHDVVDRPLGEEVAGGEAGVPGAYDNCGEVLDGECPQATSTVTSVGFVRASNTAERFWDWATSASISCLRGVGVDRERHLDVVEAVPDVAVDAEDPADVVVALDRRLDRAQLDPAILRHRRHACRQAARQPDEEILDRRDPVVLSCEDLRVIGVEHGFGLVALLFPEAEEVLDRRRAVDAVLPLG